MTSKLHCRKMNDRWYWLWHRSMIEGYILVEHSTVSDLKKIIEVVDHTNEPITKKQVQKMFEDTANPMGWDHPDGYDKGD